MITIQHYIRAQSLEQAYELNQKRRNRILGGMLWLKMTSLTVPTAIDLSGLGLDAIQESPEEFSIGAMATLRQLEQHSGLNQYTHGAAAQAVQSIVGVQFRNMATVGGSIFGRFGFSDVLTLFLALDTYAELYQGGRVPLERFAQAEPDRDILVRLIVRKRPVQCIYSSMRGSRTDFPILTCAASRLDGEYRTVIGARPARAIVLRDEGRLLEGGICEASAKAFAASVAQRTPTGSNLRGSAAYRSRLAQVLTQRAILELGGQNDGT
ncbi:MAG: hypothetical protein HFF59_02740 [Lawsonibacter sp.]|nr:hypothetical protein [Lawsonibacter sp.]MCI8989712.1 hypothetical protein [Lawsonibacter sp.]